MAFSRQKLYFREIESTDLRMLREWRNDPRMSPGWHDPRSVQTMEQQWHWYESLCQTNQAFIVMDLALADPVGLLRFSLDYTNRRGALTGTDVAPSHQGKGYGKRILRAGAEYVLHDLGFHRVTAESLDTNAGAQHIILSAGFKQEGMYRDYLWRDGKWHDWLIYSLLQEEL